jgi:hypothetical protein
MNLPIDQKTLGARHEFNVPMDLFLGAWATFEMTLDFAIGKFLQTSHEQTHLITAGMAFGRRGRLLADLVIHSDHPRKAQILGAFNKLCGMRKQEIFVHSFLQPNEEEGAFLARSANGQFRTKSPGFTKAELMDQLRAFAVAGSDFYIALGVTDADIQSFGAAAERLSTKTGRDDRSLSAAE